jgi:uncharacterized protein YutE (UPF0331/DUF86 family)
MDIDQEVMKIAKRYASQGYETYSQPGAAQLPPFAKDFKVDLLARRGDGGVLVQVKRNREDLAADPDTARYAEITSKQAGWRFDFFVLESESPMARERGEAEEFSGEDIHKALADTEQLSRAGFVQAALVTAWAALEAAMRIRLRAAGEDAGWGTMPRQMMNELYSSGIFSHEEFSQLEKLSQLRNRIVHGFTATALDSEGVQGLREIARRLLEESQSSSPAA